MKSCRKKLGIYLKITFFSAVNCPRVTHLVSYQKTLSLLRFCARLDKYQRDMNNFVGT